MGILRRQFIYLAAGTGLASVFPRGVDSVLPGAVRTRDRTAQRRQRGRHFGTSASSEDERKLGQTGHCRKPSGGRHHVGSGLRGQG